jgi:hypothetical protein
VYTPDPSDLDGHGTAVAGILLGNANNDLCSVGIAYGAKFSSCNFFSDSTSYSDLAYKLETFDISQNSIGMPCVNYTQTIFLSLSRNREGKEEFENWIACFALFIPSHLFSFVFYFSFIFIFISAALAKTMDRLTNRISSTTKDAPSPFHPNTIPVPIARENLQLPTGLYPPSVPAQFRSTASISTRKMFPRAWTFPRSSLGGIATTT